MSEASAGSLLVEAAGQVANVYELLFEDECRLGAVLPLQVESVAEMVLPPQESVEIIRHQQNLCHVEQQRYGVVEVGVGAAGVDPEVPEDGKQSRAGQQDAGHQEDVPQESVQVTPDRKEGHVEGDVSHSGVRLKDGDHS